MVIVHQFISRTTESQTKGLHAFFLVNADTVTWRYRYYLTKENMSMYYELRGNYDFYEKNV